MDLIWILLIVFQAFMVYGVWCKDWAKRNYEMGLVPGPEDLPSYVKYFRIGAVVALLFMIFMYVLYIVER